MNDFERRLDDAFPAEPLSDGLRARVARLRPTPHSSALRPLLFAGVGLGSAGLAAVLLFPRSASAAPLLAQVTKGFVGHSRTFRLDAKGGRYLENEGWYAPGRSRLETFNPQYPGTLILDERRNLLLCYDRKNGSLKIGKPRTAVVSPWFPLALDATTLADSLRQVHRLPPLEDALLDGSRVKRADLRENGRGVVLYGEPGTLRLVAFESSFVLPNRSPLHELTYLEPGLPPEGSFDPVVDLNGRRVDALRERDRIDRNFAKGLAHYSVPGGELVVRHVAMNRHGDLFVLYTGFPDEAYNGIYPTTITDDAGGVYVKGIGLIPFDAEQGFAYGGKPLAGAWYARLSGGRPRQVTITFRQPFTPGAKTEIRYTQAISPQPVDVLDFQPFMFLGLASPDAIEEGRAFALEGYYERRGQWAAMERWARRSIALSEARLPPEVRRKNYLVHYFLAEALTRQGKRAEAWQEIAEARTRISLSDDTHKEAMLRGLENRLGSRP